MGPDYQVDEAPKKKQADDRPPAGICPGSFLAFQFKGHLENHLIFSDLAIGTDVSADIPHLEPGQLVQ